MLSFDQFKKRFFPTIAEQLGYSGRNILVIVNIDDVGLHKDETEASFNALRYGIVKSGSIMAPAPNFDQVIELWKEDPEIGLGLHLTLTCEWGDQLPWSPVLSKRDVPSLYNSKGIMWPTRDKLITQANRADIKMELEAQINKVLETGLKPSHLDYHMDFAYYADLFPIAMELSCKYDLPLRVPKRRRYNLPFVQHNIGSLKRKGYVFPDSQMGLYTKLERQPQSYDYWRERYYEHMRSLKTGVHIIKIHTAFRTERLQKIIGRRSLQARQIDYDIWVSDETTQIAKELGIIFIDFRPLQKLQRRLMHRY